jgi:L-2,4-diaminobutyric acid acetyltransferase
MKVMNQSLADKNVTTHTEQSIITVRKPNPEDGSSVHQLIGRCKPLDENSMYCNLLQCSHFRDTCVIAEQGGLVVGFVSGYFLPEQPDTLFVWQVAVGEEARGQGLASRMLSKLLTRHQGRVRHLHTSITTGNDASWNTFKKLSRANDAPLNTRVMFDREQHFGDQHDTEMLVHIGPIKALAGSQSTTSGTHFQE